MGPAQPGGQRVTSKFAGKWKASVPMKDDAHTCAVPQGSTYRQPQAKPQPGRYVAGTGAKKDVPQYTGTKMVGVGVMHKSNLVPVFSDEEAQAQAKMRRG